MGLGSQNHARLQQTANVPCQRSNELQYRHRSRGWLAGSSGIRKPFSQAVSVILLASTFVLLLAATVGPGLAISCFVSRWSLKVDTHPPNPCPLLADLGCTPMTPDSPQVDTIQSLTKRAQSYQWV